MSTDFTKQERRSFSMQRRLLDFLPIEKIQVTYY